jgi:hypothetical protein
MIGFSVGNGDGSRRIVAGSARGFQRLVPRRAAVSGFRAKSQPPTLGQFGSGGGVDLDAPRHPSIFTSVIAVASQKFPCERSGIEIVDIVIGGFVPPLSFAGHDVLPSSHHGVSSKGAMIADWRLFWNKNANRR